MTPPTTDAIPAQKHVSPAKSKATPKGPSYAERTERLNALAAFLTGTAPAADHESYLPDPEGDGAEARELSRSLAFEAAGRLAMES